jgi:hypothetical protein
MAITIANIKFYQCTVWTEGGTHGGDIDTGSEITSGADENIFDDVDNAERVAGDTEYRKIYVRNENADTWEAVKAWIDTFTPATNDEISIKLGTNAGVQSVEGVASGYVSPDSKSHGDVLSIGNLVQNAYQSIWIKRVVTAAGDGYTDNNFKLAFESS